MNFPRNIIHDQKYANLATNNYQNQNLSSIISYQNLYKKLLKFQNKDKDFQSSVINWVKKLSKIQLIKYFSISNQWIVDVLHEMILISISKPNTKYIFNPHVKGNKEQILSFYNLFNQEYIYLYNPFFSDYFQLCDSGFINLGKETDQDIINKKFLNSIRYLTIPINEQFKNEYNSNSKNDNKEKTNEKFFFEYNNVVTISNEYLENIDDFLDIMQNISHNELFKNPIDFETLLNELGRKYYYNPKLSKWLNPEFSLPELLCAYFELSILLNYEYYILYQQEIDYLYYDKIEELMENFSKLLEFIGNQHGEKRVAVIQSVKNEEIKKIFNENHNLRKIITYRNSKDNKINDEFIGNYRDHKKPSIREVIENTMIKLENLFINGDFNFLLNITFIKNSVIFTEEDFVIKIVFDTINSYWKSKAAEELLYELTKNYENNANKKKRKKKKKKNKNNDKIKDKIENNKFSKNGIKKNNNELIEKKENKEELIIKDEIILNEENILNEKGEESLSIININTEDKKNIKNDINEKIINYSEEKNNILSEEQSNNRNNNKEEMQKEKYEEEENSNKKKKEKNFFLYPVVKNKNKKNKNKKNKKLINNNILNNNDNAIIRKKSEEKNYNKIIKNDILEEKKNDSEKIIKKQENQNIINLNNNKKENNEKIENYKNSKNEYDYSTKQKNKFNMGVKFKNINNIQYQKNNQYYYSKQNKNKDQSFQTQKEDLLELDGDNNGNNGYFNQNKIESNISRSKEDDKIYLVGSNIPSITSFYFNSKKKGRNHRKKHSKENYPYSLISNNISELSKEIMENTRKVNKNKEFLQKIREKYIKKIYEEINIILMNEKVDFLCSFYGSSISGLSIENSDIDIMVKLKQNRNENNYVNKIMQNVVYNLKKKKINYIINITPIYTASVPIIKLECNLSNDEYFKDELNNLIKNFDYSFNDIEKLFFDITFFEVENEKNKIPSEQMIDYIKESLILYPQLIDILYIMKRFLFNRKLNNSYQGGISSYSLFLLTLSYIKNFKNFYDIPIGSFLIEYLNYYSNFDFYSYIIQPNKDNESEIYLRSEKNSLYKFNLNIIDPITGKNVSKSTYKIEEIKKAFKEGLDNIIGSLYKVYSIDECNTIGKSKKILDIFFAK